MNERLGTVKAIARTIITTADISAELVEDAGKATLNLTSGLRHLTGAFKHLCSGVELEQELRTKVRIKELEVEYADLLA